MDFLTHVCLPLAATVAIAPSVLRSPPKLAMGAFTLFPDVDKLVGTEGLFQSLLVLVPLSLALFGIEHVVRGTRVLATLATAFLASHLVLDLLDGGPVTLLYPVVESGVGLRFPAVLTFGDGLLPVSIHGPIVALEATPVPTDQREYTFIDGIGVASVLLLVTVAVGRSYFEEDPCA
ncbi:metal-dependent hydrolase [Haloarchaeobius litoreus]|uniref:Metal-dependent hydrolase n=1 Tax=Haloarchaeobius litoreus TaxID=755306 RepID=A0ABD6DMZ4_9EURY|nr:metal-dependent hydrolase [Haloarchaeobius litoreus]